MPSLVKAQFMEISADEKATVVGGSEIDVQFNPQSLKLTFANKLGKQATQAVQDRQYLGPTSATLSFDLQFDTSDEGTTETPVSVRTRTSAIERFLQPKGEGKDKQRPPKARFIWHELRIDGIIEDLTLDIDLFAYDGTPLRAKMSVTIKEQDAKYMLGKSGAGANTAGGAKAPGAGGAGPGSFGASAGVSFGASAGASIGGGIGVSASASANLTDSTSLALAGESAAEFATRVGVDPAAWRSVTGGLDSTLSLAGGAEIDFNSSVSAGAGVGVSVGLEAGASASLEGSFGLDVRAAVPTPAGVALGGAAASAGFALSSAGGVTAALETVNILRTANAASSTKAAFGATAENATAPTDQPRAPLRQTGMPSITAQAATAPAPAPPVADTRATTFGFGVPLRPRVGGAAEARRGALSGRIPLRPDDVTTATVSSTPDPTAAPWTYLPVDSVRSVADAAQRARFPTRPCGCTGPCGHRASR
jgi:hypothetical protein